MKKTISLLLSAVLAINAFALISNSYIMNAQAATYAEQLKNKGFPQSYIDDLVSLHNKYPNWSFEPLKTGLDWSTAVAGERTGTSGKESHKRQLIEKMSSNSANMYCKCTSCYKNGSYVIQEASNWVSASQEAVEHYMDPRNWLNEKNIFQFESTAYDASQTQSGVETILNGTWMYNSIIKYKDKNGKELVFPNNRKYSESIMLAAKDSGMSAYYLASKIRQEVGGASPTAGGASGTNKTYPGIYNYYNIGAYTGALDGLKWAATTTTGYYTDSSSSVNVRKSPTTNSDIVVTLPPSTEVTYKSLTDKQSDGYKWYNISVKYNGKTYTGYIRENLIVHKTTDAYMRPWTDPNKTIYYGAKWIANNFKTQTSGYLQKFNVNPKSSALYSNEYMANVAAAASEAVTTYNAYLKAGILSAPKTFTIPIFNNMPDGDAPPSSYFTSVKGIANGFDLTWVKVKETTGYQVQYATKSDFSNAATVYAGPTDTTNKTITGRAANTKYYVRIRTYKNVNGNYIWGSWSSYEAVTTTSGVSAPSTTNFTQIKAIANGFDLSWNKLSDAKGYQIQYATRSDFANCATVKTDETNIAITGRAAGTKYYVRVRAYKISNGSELWGNWSNAEAITTPSKPSPTSFTSVQGINNGFTLNWSKVSETTGYQVQYATKSDFSNAATVYAGPTDTINKTITGRAANTKYYVRIRTYKNISGNYVWGNWSSYVAVTTTSATPAPPATSFTETQGISKGFTLKWSKVAETTGYQVQYATKSDFSNAATVYAGPTDTTSKTITGRAANTKYYVRIRTYKNIGGSYVWGEWSPSKTVVTLV